MVGCLASNFVRLIVADSPEEGRTVLCNRFRGNAIPCAVSHQYALIVSGKNAEPLMIITNIWSAMGTIIGQV